MDHLLFNGLNAILRTAVLQVLRSAHVTRDEVLASMRAAGHSELDSIHAVVIETDALFTVIAHAGRSEDTLLAAKYDRTVHLPGE